MNRSITSHKRRLLLSGAVVMVASVSGCGSDSENPPPATPSPSPAPGPAPCTADGFPPIIITVIDAVTRELVTSPTGSATHTDGTTIEFLSDTRNPGLLWLPGLKYGDYAVKLQAAGYRDWVQDRVETPFGAPGEHCPRSHRLTAELVRST